MSQPPIKGKIAAIVTPRQVIINRGEKQGVKPGMKLTVHLTIGPIIDPDNPAEELGTVRYRKGVLQVRTVFEKMSACDIEGVPTVGFTPDLGKLLQQRFPQVATPAIESAADWIIKVGDTVTEIVEDTSDSQKPGPKE